MCLVTFLFYKIALSSLAIGSRDFSEGPIPGCGTLLFSEQPAFAASRHVVYYWEEPKPSSGLPHAYPHVI